MHRNLPLLAAPFALALLLATAPGPAEATPPDTLVIAKNIDDIISLDPAEAYEASGGEVITNVYDRLIRFEADDLTKLVGGVAESWTVSPDGHEITFVLRKGLTFTDGAPVTAEDVAFSLQRVAKLNKTPAFLLTQFGWTPENVAQNVQALDAGTVRLTIPADLAPSLVLNVLSSTIGSVVEKQLAMQHQAGGDLGNSWLKAHSAGSGAYQLRSWAANESVVLEANPGFHLGAPKLRRVVVRHVADPLAQRLMLERGDADIARNLTSDEVASLRTKPAFSVASIPSADTYYVAVNQSDPKLANPKVLQAMHYLIDYHGIADKLLKGGFAVSETFLPSAFQGSLDEAPYNFDPGKAKQLLAEAGFSDGLSATLELPSASPWSEIGQSIQATMAQAGVRLELQQEEQKQLWTRYRARQHQMLLIQWSPDYLDPHSNAEAFVRDPDVSDQSSVRTLAWRNHWADPQLTAQVDAAVRERDAAKRIALYEQLQREVLQRGPYLIMLQPVTQIAMTRSVHDFVVGPYWDLVFYRKAAK